jgi:hypothetical protein
MKTVDNVVKQPILIALKNVKIPKVIKYGIVKKACTPEYD